MKKETASRLSTQEIVTGIVNKNRIAENVFYEMFYHRLYVYINRRFSKSQEEIEDILQETFLRAIIAIRKGAYCHQEMLSTWLHTIARNYALDFLYKKKSISFVELGRRTEDGDFVEFPIPSSLPSPLDILLVKERYDALLRAINKLPARKRDTVIAICLREELYREYSNRTGVSLGTVKGDIFRSKQKLKKYLRAA